MSETAKIIKDLAQARGVPPAEVIYRMTSDFFWTSPEEAYEVIEHGAVAENVAFVHDLKEILDLDVGEIRHLMDAMREDFGRAEEERLAREP